MKKMIALMMALILCLSLAACQASQQESTAPEQTTENKESLSGINDDGMGDDPTFGEGIGEVVALTPEEESYMMKQTTNSWLEMSEQEKDDLVVLIGRYLEDSQGFIVEDYDDLIKMLDHQMEQYYRNKVDENVLATVRDVCDID